MGNTESCQPGVVFSNPASASAMGKTLVQAEFTSHYLGFSDDILASGGLGIGLDLTYGFSYGASFRYLRSDIYQRSTFEFLLSKEFVGKLTIGIRGKIFHANYSRENFILEPDEVDDPLFTGDLQKTSEGLDAGLIYIPHPQIILGSYIENMISPDMSFVGSEEKWPIKIHGGARYNVFDYLTLAIDGVYDLEYIDSQKMTLAGGVEFLLFNNTLILRSGANNDFITTGIGLNNLLNMPFRFEYAFGYPLSNIAQAGGTSHKFGISYEFIPKENTALQIVPTEQIEIEVNPAIVMIDTLKIISDEQAIVPIFFFDANSFEIDERFHKMASFIRNRLYKNENAHLHIRGYFDPESDSLTNQIALERSLAVRRILINDDYSDRIIIDSIGYDMSRPRAGLGQNAPDSIQQKMINQENRRVELSIELHDSPEILSHENHKVIDYLNRNPDLDVVWKLSPEEQIPEFEKLSPNILLSRSDSSSMIYIPSSIINKPPENHSISTNHGNLPDAAIFIKEKSRENYNIWQLDILDENGSIFRTIASGKNSTIPRKQRFDWRDKDSNLVQTSHTYFARLIAQKNDSVNYEVYSRDSLRLIVMERKIVDKKMTLIRFVYDQTASLESYLNYRQLSIAQEIIRLSRESHKRINVEIMGHTDILGTVERNIELSQQRAEKQYQELLKNLKFLLSDDGYDPASSYDHIAKTDIYPKKSSQNISPKMSGYRRDDSEFSEWLIENKIEIKYIGFGSEKAYRKRIHFGPGLDGDNKLPEGRIINRRVEIKIIVEE